MAELLKYKLNHTGPEVDSAVGRALPGGAIDQSMSAKLDWEGLINPEFTIAQAGIGGNHGSVPYAADCWKLVSGTVSAAPGGGLVLNGTIRQTLETAVGFDAVASINVTSGTATAAYDDATKQFDITSSGGTIKRAHLGLRAIADWTKMPKQKREDTLRECQLYYFAKHYAQYETIGLGYVSQQWVALSIGIGAQMRSSTPTAVLSGTLAFVGASPTENVTSFTQCSCSGTVAQIGISATAATQGACYAYPVDSSGATIELINDL